MERWYTYGKIQVRTEHIYEVSGGDRECRIFFSNVAKQKHALHFDEIVDFRYAVKDTFRDRIAKQSWSNSVAVAGLYTVESSDYVKYFEDQCLM